MSFYMDSDKGNVRKNNEDSFLFEKYEKLNILILADGMGGHEDGEIASKMAVDFVMNFIKSNYKFYTDFNRLLVDAFCKSNEFIYDANLKKLSKNAPDIEKMGTTLETLLVVKDMLYFAHVGDSRIYLKDKSNLKQITKDHSLVEYLYSNGAITKDEADNFEQKNSILRAIGVEQVVEVDTGKIKLSDGDILVVCSDGLTNELSDIEISNILDLDMDSEKLVKFMIDTVKKKTAKDNVTVGIYKYKEVI